MTAQIHIPGDARYSHAHYWRTAPLDPDEPLAGTCGLATPGGTCRWPKEPGTPWCNACTHRWLVNAKAAGYVSSEQVRWAAQQSGLPEDFAAALVRRWERFFAPPPPKPAPEAPAPSGATWEPPPPGAVVGVDLAAEPADTEPADTEPEPKVTKKTPRRIK